ncbi:MAG TPA: helix-turn-helix domain-containing protein [Actinocrinis sp.]|uniref:PucR family transcriptional regulator n=1 Tax=Actinocrinis sp. TaxID=1920516 RepID=UPI002DDD1E01|nr:helix-turn-helix domain-containing protein [Actinocrinis sp.]HEV2347690.1 helix-turn-helix domain-containing protein [Actinocrinis sp.]
MSPYAAPGGGPARQRPDQPAVPARPPAAAARPADIDPGHPAVLGSLAKETRRQLPELTARAVKVITDRVGDIYGARGIVIADDLRSVTEANMAGMLDVIAGSRSAGPDDLYVPLSTGRRRAEQGVPLEAVLHAFRLGGQELLSALLTRARGRTPEELAVFLEHATVAFDVVDTYSQAVVEGYRQAETQLQCRGSRRRQAVFDSLLDGVEAEPAALGEHASVLGLPESGPYVLVVYHFELADQFAPTAARDVCAARGLVSAWRTRGDTEVGIVSLGRTPPARLMEHLRSAVAGRLGLSSVFDSLRDVPEAYRLAVIALRTVETEPKGIAWIEERLLEAMVVSSPDLSGRLALRTLGRVLALRKPDRELLLDTLSAWYECGRSANVAAARLYCHRNTVLNRLKRIEELIGVSLDDHNGLITCYIALVVLRLLPQKAVRQPATVRA